jgi:hypothetical protein
MNDAEWQRFTEDVDEGVRAGSSYDRALRQVVTDRIKAASRRMVAMRFPDGRVVTPIYEGDPQ